MGRQINPVEFYESFGNFVMNNISTLNITSYILTRGKDISVFGKSDNKPVEYVLHMRDWFYAFKNEEAYFNRELAGFKIKAVKVSGGKDKDKAPNGEE